MNGANKRGGRNPGGAMVSYGDGKKPVIDLQVFDGALLRKRGWMGTALRAFRCKLVLLKSEKGLWRMVEK